MLFENGDFARKIIVIQNRLSNDTLKSVKSLLGTLDESLVLSRGEFFYVAPLHEFSSQP